MKTEITTSNLPNLGIEPFKRFDGDGFLTNIFYSFLNGSTVSIKFNGDGYVSEMSYNGHTIPNNSQLDLIDGRLHIIIPTV